MDIKKLVVGSVVAGVAMLAVNFVLGMVPTVGDYFGADTSVWGLAHALFHGALVVIVLGWRGIGDAADGAKGGAVFGIAMALAAGISGGVNAALIGSVVAAAVVTGVAGAALAMAPGGSDG